MELFRFRGRFLSRAQMQRERFGRGNACQQGNKYGYGPEKQLMEHGSSTKPVVQLFKDQWQRLAAKHDTLIARILRPLVYIYQAKISCATSGSTVMGEFGLRGCKKRTGQEPLHRDGIQSQTTLLEFWQWVASDLLSNTLRGHYAEFLVASALGLTDEPRVEWNSCDLLIGQVRIEVKSGAYIQSWKRNGPSSIRFSIQKSLGWDWEKNCFDKIKKRQADIYVFGFLNCKDPDAADPLNLSQWQFLVLRTIHIDEQLRDQSSISLGGLRKLPHDEVDYWTLADALHRNSELIRASGQRTGSPDELEVDALNINEAGRIKRIDCFDITDQQ